MLILTSLCAIAAIINGAVSFTAGLNGSLRLAWLALGNFALFGFMVVSRILG